MANVLKNTIPKIASPRKPFTVFIEGNIGAGKTTFLNHFKKYDDVCLYTEPVEKWRNVQGFNLLVNDMLIVLFSFNILLKIGICHLLLDKSMGDTSWTYLIEPYEL